MGRLQLAKDMVGLVFERREFWMTPLALLMIILAREPRKGMKKAPKEEQPLGPYVYPFA